MNKRKNGSILIAFVVMIFFSVLVITLLLMSFTGLKSNMGQQKEVTAFNNAQAGLNKGLWMLSQSISPSGSSPEVFSNGTILITFSYISSTEVQITSTGEVAGVTRVLQQNATVIPPETPEAFKYAMYSDSPLKANNNATIIGDIYTNGDTDLGKANMTGFVFHPAGNTVDPPVYDGGSSAEAAAMPVLLPSIYDIEIAIAALQPPGNMSLGGTVDLTAGNIYVNGDVNINSGVAFIGPGKVVATGDFTINGCTSNGEVIWIVSGRDIRINGNADMDGAVIYAAGSIAVGGNTVTVGALITPGDADFGGGSNVDGLVYTGGTVTIAGGTVFTGAFCGGEIVMKGGTTVEFNQANIPTGYLGFLGTLPIVTAVPQSWKQLR